MTVSREGAIRAAARPDGLRVLAAAYVFSVLALNLHWLTGARANVLLAVVTVAILIFSIGNSEIRLLGHDWAYLTFIALALLSVTWSIAPQATLEQALPMMAPWLATLFLSDLCFDAAARIVIRFAIVAAALAPVMIIISRDLAYQPGSSTGYSELRGIFSHQLFLGAFLVVALGIIAVSYMNGEAASIVASTAVTRMLVVGLLIAVLFLSRTRIYVAVGLVCLALTWMLSRRGSRKSFWLSILAVFGVTFAFTFSGMVSRLEERGFDTTLTGRTRIWERALTAVSEGKELLGFGFGTFQSPTFDYLFFNYRPQHAHNGFINTFFEVGFVGLALVVALIVAQMAAAWRYSVRSNRYSYSLFLVLFCVLGSLTGGAMYTGVLVPAFCLMLLFLAIESRSPLIDRVPASRTRH